MPVMTYVRGLKRGPLHVFLALPTYIGSVPDVFLSALWESSFVLSEAGIGADLCIESGNCHVDDARNSLVRQFLETDCTDLVFLDDDISWSPEDLVRLVSYDRDVVAGVYPKKQDEEEFPVLLKGGEIWSENDGLIEVDGAPTGFMRIKRHVLEGLREIHESRKFSGQEGKEYHPIFERSVIGGRRRSGDYAFCLKWQELGGKVYVDPEMKFSHKGSKYWFGSLGNHLREKNGLISPLVNKGIEKIKSGDESGFVDLCNGWDNPHSGTPEFLAAVYKMAEGGPFLETGSGITTLLLALKGEVHSLENDLSWMKKVNKALEICGLKANVHYCPIKQYEGFTWYEVPELPEKFSLAVCDGPQRKYGRKGLYKILGGRFEKVIMDDANDPVCLADLKDWAKDLHTLGTERQFAVGIK